MKTKSIGSAFLIPEFKQKTFLSHAFVTHSSTGIKLQSANHYKNIFYKSLCFAEAFLL
jgi:hypothetical protein